MLNRVKTEIINVIETHTERQISLGDREYYSKTLTI